MVGLSGVVGEQSVDLEEFAEAISHRGTECTAYYREDPIGIAYVDHPPCFDDQPVRLDDDRRLWLWGIAIGHGHDGTYRPRPDSQSGVEFAAGLDDRFGESFVAGLNSKFAGILVDRSAETVSFLTDRLGSRPIYYTRSDDGSLVFSPLIQSLAVHPGVALEFDAAFLSEFLHYHRSLGVTTPVEGVSQLPPASVVRVGFDGRFVDQWRYWWPNPTPRARAFTASVDAFANTFTRAVRDRVTDGEPIGLFLSGGIDSRAILAALDTDTVAFHLNESRHRNREARIADRAAAKAGVKFVFLHRDIDHYPAVLEATGPVTNFNGYFRVANHLGFEDDITDRVGAVMNGQYSDTLIGPTYVPMHDGEPQPIESVDAYVDAFDAGTMGGHAKDVPFLDGLPDPADVLREQLTVESDRIWNHGVPYPSWEALVQFGMVYPITNVRSFIWYETQVHSFPTHYPFLDNRLIDLVLEMPGSDRYGRDVVGDVLERLYPALASIETLADHPMVFHLRHTPPRRLVGDLMRFAGLRAGTVSMTRPDSHLSPQSGFPSTPGLIRSHPFIGDLLEENREAIESSPVIDGDRLRDCYEQHLAGDNYADRLFGIAGVLQSEIQPELSDETTAGTPPQE